MYLYRPLLKRMIAFYSGTLFLKNTLLVFFKGEQKSIGPLALYFYNWGRLVLTAGSLVW